MYLNATAHTPVGVFYGTTHLNDIEVEEAKKLRDEIQERINKLEFLVLFTESENEFPAEITLCGTLIKNSVFEFRIEDNPCFQQDKE